MLTLIPQQTLLRLTPEPILIAASLTVLCTAPSLDSREHTLFIPTLLRFGIDSHWEVRIEGNTFLLQGLWLH